MLNMTMMISGLLVLPLDAQNLTQQSNLQLLQMGKLNKVDGKSTKLVVVGSAWGTGPAVLNRLKYVCLYLLLVFIL